MRVTKTSPFTGNTHTLDIPCTVDQLERWKAGEGMIQEIMPDVPAELREFLMTGITPEEWDKFLGPETDMLDYDMEVEVPDQGDTYTGPTFRESDD